MAFPCRYLICLWLYAPVVCPGQVQTSQPHAVAVHFTVFSRQRLTGLCYQPSPRARPVGVQFFPQARSERFGYRGPAELAFYEEADWTEYTRNKAANPAAALPSPVAVARLPVGMKEALLLFVPLPEAQAGGIRFGVLAVDDDPARFPPGQLGVINVTGRVYTAQVGRKVLAVPPGRGENLAVAGPVEFRLACREEGQWVAAGHHAFTVGPTSRVCLVLFPATSATGVGPVIRTLVDAPPSKARERTAALLAPAK